jgi:ABC-2 type transport system ATP-binding protein
MSRTQPNKPTGRTTARPVHPQKPSRDNPVAARRAAAAKASKAERAARPKPEAKPAGPTRPSGPPPAVWAAGLTKEYGDLPALAPLDLTIRQREAVVLIGHNGSGKTTLLRMAAGLLEPTGGIVEVMGHGAGTLGARAAVSYLSDNPTFYEDLSAWEHMEYVARLHGRVDWEQDAADLLGDLGLYDRADELPVTFSRGLRQKTAIALAFIRPFDLLLVDEPFVGLDAAGKATLFSLLDGARQQAALLVATHELEYVQRVDRCLALRDGTLAYDGPTSGIDVLSLVS